MKKPVCIIAGVGPGIGTAFARKFIREGYSVALLARTEHYLKELENQLENAKAYRCDLTQLEEVKAVFQRIPEELGTVEVLIYNAGGGRFCNVEEATPEDFEKAWRVNTYGCLLATQQTIPAMRHASQKQIFIIGATASLRGRAGFAPFASAKGAQRNLAQSIANHLGPQGIHVTYVIIDGLIDMPRNRERLPNKPDQFFMQPEHIADSIYLLTQQPRSAWTLELDLKPFAEE